MVAFDTHPVASDLGPETFYYPVGETRVVEAAGARMLTADGRVLLDGISGTFNLSLGHCHPEVVAAVKEQADRLAFVTSSFRTAPTDELAAALVAISPSNLTRVHLRSSGGSEANEGAVRIAQHVTGRRDVVTMFRHHLGQTLAMASLSGFASRREPFPHRFPGSVVVPGASCSRCFYGQSPETCGMLCVRRIDDFLTYAGSGSTACVIVEPITGAGGNELPPPGYLAELKRFCDERSIVLVFDEVQTGFGRTGRMFAADHFGVSPHMMTLAKGMTGSGFPMAAILTEDRLMGLGKEFHGFTSGGHALGAAAAVKTIEIIQREGFLENVRHVGAELLHALAALGREHDFIGEARGVGLMLGVAIVGPDGEGCHRTAVALAEASLEEGLVVRVAEHGRGSVIELRPPLIIDSSDAAEIVQRFAAACARVGATVRS